MSKEYYNNIAIRYGGTAPEYFEIIQSLFVINPHNFLEFSDLDNSFYKLVGFW